MMLLCKKCGNLASYNSYFGAYYCSTCGEYFQPQYDGSTQQLIDELRRYGATHTNGKMCSSCFVPKDLLIAAADRLELIKSK